MTIASNQLQLTVMGQENSSVVSSILATMDRMNIISGAPQIESVSAPMSAEKLFLIRANVQAGLTSERMKNFRSKIEAFSNDVVLDYSARSA